MNGLTIGLTLPFLGTVLGAACVFMMKHSMPRQLEKVLMGFAAGVMVAASVWSLLIPSMEMTGREGFMQVMPAMVGFMLGMGFLLLLDVAVPHQHIDGGPSEGPKSKLSRTTKLVFAVTLHNIPEGMAVGVALAAALEHSTYIPMAGALALSLGIAIQNFPEGAIISMPLQAEGMGKGKAFLYGVLSGVVEPLAALLTICAAGYILPALPYLLSFAAGAMIYVVVEELIPEASAGEHSNLGTLFFAAGFTIMLAEIASNTAAAAIVLPVVISVTQELNLNPIPYIFITAAAFNCAYILPTSIRAIPVAFGLKPSFMGKNGVALTLLSILTISLFGWLLLRFVPAFGVI